MRTKLKNNKERRKDRMSTSDTLALIQVIAAFASIGIDILLAVIGFKIDRRNKQMNERSQADHVENVSQAIPPEIPRVDVPKDSNTIKKIDFAFKRIRKDASMGTPMNWNLVDFDE